MGELFGILSHYVQGKPVFAPLRKVLDLLLSFNIAFFIWDKYYGPVQWDHYDEYGEIMDFVLRGGFFIPACILVLAHFAIKGTGSVVMGVFETFNKWTMNRQRWKLRFVDPDLNGKPSGMGKALLELDSGWPGSIPLYEALKRMQQRDKATILATEASTKEKRTNLRESFDVAWKLLVASVIFRSIQPEMGPWLASLITTFCILTMGITSLMIQILALIPEFVRQFAAEAESYLQKAQPPQENATETSTPQSTFETE